LKAKQHSSATDLVQTIVDNVIVSVRNFCFREVWARIPEAISGFCTAKIALRIGCSAVFQLLDQRNRLLIVIHRSKVQFRQVAPRCFRKIASRVWLKCVVTFALRLPGKAVFSLRGTSCET
jgi:hypothetical protein